MAEDIEKTQREQAVKIQTEAGWDCHREEHEDITDENIKEHIEECLGEMLYSYSEDKRNYVLDGAVISCSQMSDKMVSIQFTENGSKISIEGGGKPVTSTYKKPVDIGPEGYDYGSLEHIIPSHVGEKNIRKLHAVFGNGQSDNGIRFATVIDRSYLREKEEGSKPKADTTSNAVKAIGAGIKSAYEAAKENLVSIVSCGNCKKLEEGDIKKIAENWEGVRKYGTCYALIQPASRWINPYCMESVTEGCESTANSVSDGVYCTVEEHHKPMKFSTLKGEKEGLTMMSTLLCGKEGIITIEASGQIYVEPKVEDMEVAYEFKYDCDKEGLPNSENITPEFLAKVVEIARELEIEPDDLMAVMAFESWFNPQQGNIESGAYGLIQFTEITLSDINQRNGTTYKKDDLTHMSILEQLDLVYLHYKPKAGLMHDLGDVYLVTFAPKYVTGEVLDDSTIIYSESDGKKYEQNKGLDKGGKGYITKGDAVQVVIDRREEYLYEN